MLREVRNRWRRSFVASVTVLAFLGVVLFAAVIGRLVHDQISDQAFDRAAETAEILARGSFAPPVPAAGQQLAPKDLAALDRQLREARRREPLLDVRVWAAGGTILYARDRGQVGRRLTPPGPVADALNGKTSSAVSGETLTTAAPIVRSAGGATAGALELDLPYGPVQDDVNRRTWRLVLALGAIALLVYLLALPGLLRASRALRAQYDPRRVEVVRELKQALARDELLVHFQPIAEAATRRTAAAEALVRWQHPRRGNISPDNFIPVIENTDVMWPLTLRVLELAVRECARWRAEGHDVAVAVNVSGGVLDDRRLPREVQGLLDRCGLDPSALEIEVTEGAVMKDADAASRMLLSLAELGISVIAIDDFGTGYSSLARLHELPLDTLKIDQSFVRRMAEEGDEQVVTSIIELAHALGMKVIAEGAEDDDTIDRLAELGCDYVQGYGLTRPLPPADFADWLAAAESRRRAMTA